MPAGKFYKRFPAKKKATKYAAKPKIRMSQLPRAVVPEMKRKNLVIENENLTVLGQGLSSIMAPFQIAENVGLAYRVGRQITARGLHVKGHMFNKTGNPCFFVRMLILEDKEKQTQTFNGDELLMKQSQAVSHAQGTESAYLSINKNRYKVYSDKLIKLSASNTNAENVKIFSTFIKLNHTVKYDGTGTGDITNRNIQIACFPINPSGAVVVAQRVEINYHATAYYQDA